MEKGEEFRWYLRAVRKKFESGSGRHLVEDELIAYYQGRLEGPEREEAQSHLECCGECAEAFKGVYAFFESPEEQSEPISEMAIDRRWEVWWRRARTGERPTPQELEPRSPGSWRNPRATFALAASLVLATAVTSLWAIRLRQQNQHLIGQRQLEESTWNERLSGLEEENRRLQGQVSDFQQSSESQLAELRQPSVNVAIYDLLPQGSVSRSGAGHDIDRVRIPATTSNVVVILHRDDNRKFPAYEIEIVDRNGQSRWRGTGVEPASDGSFVMTLDRTFLTPGEYRLRLYGRRGPSSRQVAEYQILVE